MTNEESKGESINEKLFMTGRDLVKYVLVKDDTRERIIKDWRQRHLLDSFNAIGKK